MNALRAWLGISSRKPLAKSDAPQLRHSGVVHACDGLGPNASWSLPAIMAKSRHQSIRSVERYAYCPPDTAAALTDDLDQARRKR